MSTVFKTTPNPTFRATVEIPVPGGEAQPLEVEFAYKTIDELKALFSGFPGRPDVDCLMDFVVGWHNHPDEFSRDALAALLQTYGRASVAIRNAYAFELTGARLGN